MTAKQTVAAAEPSLSDVLALLKKDVMLNLTAHHVGIIKKFTAATQTANVQIAYKKTYFTPNAITGEYEATLTDYPLIIDCPVVFIGGGLSSLTFPVAVGDECLVLFNDRDIDGWYAGSTSNAPPTLRLHSVSDGFALVGIRSLAKSIPSFATDKAEFKYGTNASVSVGASASVLKFGTAVVSPKSNDKIQFNNATVTLKAVLQGVVDELTNLNTQLVSLVTQISAITVAGVTPGPSPSGPIANLAAFPPIATNISGISTNLATIKANMGVLLE